MQVGISPAHGWKAGSAEIKAQLAKYGTWVERKITDPGF